MTPSFVFSEESIQKIDKILQKYPKARQQSALLPLLDLAQRDAGGWLPKAAIEAVATLLHIPYMRVFEVASFYTMFNLKPVGTYQIKVCGTTPCCLRGAEDIMETCKKHLKIDLHETTPDGIFTLTEFECLGACVNAPVVQINDDYMEDVTPDGITHILDQLKNGAPLTPTSCLGRKGSKAYIPPKEEG